jgi:hypothetical protein
MTCARSAPASPAAVASPARRECPEKRAQPSSPASSAATRTSRHTALRTAGRRWGGRPCSTRRTAAAPHPRRRRTPLEAHPGLPRRQRTAGRLGRVGPDGHEGAGAVRVGLGAADSHLQSLPRQGHHIAHASGPTSSARRSAAPKPSSSARSRAPSGVSAAGRVASIFLSRSGVAAAACRRGRMPVLRTMPSSTRRSRASPSSARPASGAPPGWRPGGPAGWRQTGRHRPGAPRTWQPCRDRRRAVRGPGGCTRRHRRARHYDRRGGCPPPRPGGVDGGAARESVQRRVRCGVRRQRQLAQQRRVMPSFLAPRQHYSVRKCLASDGMVRRVRSTAGPLGHGAGSMMAPSAGVRDHGIYHRPIHLF